MFKTMKPVVLGMMAVTTTMLAAPQAEAYVTITNILPEQQIEDNQVAAAKNHRKRNNRRWQSKKRVCYRVRIRSRRGRIRFNRVCRWVRVR